MIAQVRASTIAIATAGLWMSGAVAAQLDSAILDAPRASTALPTAVVPILDSANAPRYRPHPALDIASAGTAPLPISRLSEAVKLAYNNDRRLLAQRAQLRATDQRVPAARAAYGPSLEVQGAYGFTHDRNDTIVSGHPNQEGWASSASAILTQPVLTFGRNRAAESVALAQVEHGRDQLRVLESQLVLAVVSDYVEVIRDANTVSIARQNVAILAREFKDDQARFAVREITRTDLNQVENRLAAARGGLVQAEGQLAGSQARFLRDVGAPPGELEIPDVLDLPVETLEDAYAIADVESLLVHAAQSREKISRAGVQAAGVEWAPRVDMRGVAAIGTVSPYDDLLRTRRLQAQLLATIPIYDSGRQSAHYAEALESNQSDWLLIDQALRETRANVAGAWDQMASARTSLKHYINAVEAARRAYEGSRIEARAGARTILEVLDLARDLLFVQTSYNAALANEYVARASLLAAMGRLEAPRLVPDTVAIDPRQHFDRIDRASDLPLLTPLLRTLDGLVLDSIDDDRPIRDASALVQATAPMTLPPEDPALIVDPTAIDRDTGTAGL